MFSATMNTKNQIPNTPKIKITKNGARIAYGDNVELPVSIALVRQYLEYMLIANQPITIELVP